VQGAVQAPEVKFTADLLEEQSEDKRTYTARQRTQERDAPLILGGVVVAVLVLIGITSPKH